MPLCVCSRTRSQRASTGCSGWADGASSSCELIARSNCRRRTRSLAGWPTCRHCVAASLGRRQFANKSTTKRCVWSPSCCSLQYNQLQRSAKDSNQHQDTGQEDNNNSGSTSESICVLRADDKSRGIIAGLPLILYLCAYSIINTDIRRAVIISVTQAVQPHPPDVSTS